MNPKASPASGVSPVSFFFLSVKKTRPTTMINTRMATPMKMKVGFMPYPSRMMDKGSSHELTAYLGSRALFVLGLLSRDQLDPTSGVATPRMQNSLSAGAFLRGRLVQFIASPLRGPNKTTRELCPYRDVQQQTNTAHSSRLPSGVLSLQDPS